MKSDKAFIAALHKKQPEAVRELFNQLYRPMIYFADKLINNMHESEDIVATAFFKLTGRIEQFQSLRDIKAFLYITVRNECLDHLRRLARHEKSHEQLQYLMDYTDAQADDEMLRARILQEVYNEIEQLPSQCKKIFKLIFSKGMTTRQIAEELELSPQTVLNQKAKALNLLRGVLAKKNLMPLATFFQLFCLISMEFFC
ncbi:sigma-70 family RNA polymerase sigma factor [Pseudoflavitalea sp. G-6-1-2]|uniref:RNA polymerase sigma factor n=1 Tax=Pseudoflavitalea sp. G-6-1-2 TaxID=2728841 RepID=UPI00146E45A6|nr:sigma-70 family RNA polymerase sigma factor [Pseudoflavitalea sp. G-6-1-2]NML19370.1 sigma-70 family RNA polymerase sigma factor [Pseudoflavitalea sp. G-6-1-2]